MSRPICSIPGCEKESRGRGWCAKHWSRWRSTGDPTGVKVPGVDYMVKNVNPCSVDDCETVQLAKGLCTKHYARMRKHGDVNHVDPGGRPLKGAHPTWAAIHKRVMRIRGKAANYSCVDCGSRAREWSYDNQDPNELIGRSGRYQLRYSLDVDHYEARCTPCHRRFDIRERNAAA